MSAATYSDCNVVKLALETWDRSSASILPSPRQHRQHTIPSIAATPRRVVSRFPLSTRIRFLMFVYPSCDVQSLRSVPPSPPKVSAAPPEAWRSEIGASAGRQSLCFRSKASNILNLQHSCDGTDTCSPVLQASPSCPAGFQGHLWSASTPYQCPKNHVSQDQRLSHKSVYAHHRCTLGTLTLVSPCTSRR